MTIRPYKITDLEEINTWYEKHGIQKVQSDYLPNLGFIAEGIAAIFVYMTDSSIALVEGLVSNPEISVSERAKAMEILTDYAVNEALKRKSVALAIIKGRGVKRLAKKIGLTSIGEYELFTKG